MIVHQSLFGQSTPQALTENHNVVPSFSPGLAAQRPTPGNMFHKIQPLTSRECGTRKARMKIAAHSPKIQCCFSHSQTISNPKSTLNHPKSTVDLECEELIRVDNGLRSPLSPTSYQLISTPKIKEFNQTHLSRLGNGEKNLSRPSGTKAARPSERERASPTATGQKILLLIATHGGRPRGPFPLLSSVRNSGTSRLRAIVIYLRLFTPIYRYSSLFGPPRGGMWWSSASTYASLCQPMPATPPPPIFTAGGRPQGGRDAVTGHGQSRIVSPGHGLLGKKRLFNFL